MRLAPILTAILVTFSFGSIPVAAQTVTVQSGDSSGHGFLVRDGTTCYLLLPKHVSAGSRSVTVFSAAPVVHGSALVETPFWDGMDLAIGVVRGAVAERCATELSQLDAKAQPETGAAVQLLRLRQSGEPERIAMMITDSQYLTLDAEVIDGKSELFKGTSGAFLFSGDKPVGMVIETLSSTEGRFIRIEEIFMNLQRRTERRSGFAAAAATPVQEPVEPEATTSLPFEFISASLPPIEPDQSEANLTGPGHYVFQLTRPNRLAFKVKGNTAIALSQIQLRSAPGGGHAVPRNVLIELSSTADGLRTRAAIPAEMGPDGILDLKLQPTIVRWVFITIGSGWDGAKIGIDLIEFQ